MLFSFSAKKGKNFVFCSLVDRREAILDYKNIDLKKWKILHLFKGVSEWFLVKNWKFCPCLFSCKIGQNKMFFAFQKTGKPFYTIKTSI